MTRGTRSPLDPDALLADFNLYDRAVDVVSAHHWLFTETAELPRTVTHFERYPKIKHPDGNDATPDFTVLFTDGTGMAAEVANIALHDGSVEKLCGQLDRYSHLTELPASATTTAPVSVVDVLYLCPMDTAASAVQRVLRDRADDPRHSFKPVRRPVIVQFANTPDRYIFQLWPDDRVNGSFHVSGRTPDYALFTKELKIPPDRFAHNKVRHGFMNDPVKPLYMATRLWASVFPSEFGAGNAEFNTTTHEVATLVRAQYGHGVASDVRAGMQTLVAAGLATVEPANTWKVKRRNLRSDADDVHLAIAERVGLPMRRLRPVPRFRAMRRVHVTETHQDTLFDQDA